MNSVLKNQKLTPQAAVAILKLLSHRDLKWLRFEIKSITPMQSLQSEDLQEEVQLICATDLHRVELW